MFCPSCGHQNPDNARYCMVCGKSPGAAIAPAAATAQTVTQREPEKKSHALRNLLIVFGLVAVWYVFVIRPGGGPLLSGTHTEALTPSQFTVKAGSIYYVKFNVGRSGRVVGRFEASGGQGNDVQVVVANADSFENWQNGHTAQVLYQTDKTTVGTLNVPITQPGTFHSQQHRLKKFRAALRAA
jgi:hypothetical protein